MMTDPMKAAMRKCWQAYDSRVPPKTKTFPGRLDDEDVDLEKSVLVVCMRKAHSLGAPVIDGEEWHLAGRETWLTEDEFRAFDKAHNAHLEERFRRDEVAFLEFRNRHHAPEARAKIVERSAAVLRPKWFADRTWYTPIRGLDRFNVRAVANACGVALFDGPRNACIAAGFAEGFSSPLLFAWHVEEERQAATTFESREKPDEPRTALSRVLIHAARQNANDSGDTFAGVIRWWERAMAKHHGVPIEDVGARDPIIEVDQ